MSLAAVPLRCEKAPGMEALDKYKDVQLISSECIAGKEHLESAIHHAELAFKRGENISKNPLIEVVVRASLERQIKNAFEIFGIGNTKTIISISEKYPEGFIDEYMCQKDESVLLLDEKKYERIKEVFEITEKEIMAVSSGDFGSRVKTMQRIIAERMALLNKI